MLSRGGRIEPIVRRVASKRDREEVGSARFWLGGYITLPQLCGDSALSAKLMTGVRAMIRDRCTPNNCTESPQLSERDVAVAHRIVASGQ
jgi:hypothetical protein